MRARLAKSRRSRALQCEHAAFLERLLSGRARFLIFDCDELRTHEWTLAQLYPGARDMRHLLRVAERDCEPDLDDALWLVDQLRDDVGNVRQRRAALYASARRAAAAHYVEASSASASSSSSAPFVLASRNALNVLTAHLYARMCAYGERDVPRHVRAVATFLRACASPDVPPRRMRMRDGATRALCAARRLAVMYLPCARVRAPQRDERALRRALAYHVVETQIEARRTRRRHGGADDAEDEVYVESVRVRFGVADDGDDDCDAVHRRYRATAHWLVQRERDYEAARRELAAHYVRSEGGTPLGVLRAALRRATHRWHLDDVALARALRHYAPINVDAVDSPRTSTLTVPLARRDDDDDDAGDSANNAESGCEVHAGFRGHDNDDDDDDDNDDDLETE